MARPQKFDTNTVLDQAMAVFWLKGYDDTSIQDLVDATGLNRGSLYNAFGDKAQLFAQVMEHYKANSPARQLVQAPEGTSPRTLIQDFLTALVLRAQKDPDRKGCLITNTAAGLYGCDEAMNEWICNTLETLENVLTKVIILGQERSEITSERDAQTLARFLVTTAQGINVIASSQVNLDHLSDVVDQVMWTLGDPDTITKPKNDTTDGNSLAFPSDPQHLY
ncbi:MAG: TetR/AcrR family transcriptional regulator [Magnetovibrio sp.]|nr:TetR/AcrR family transcriptional regulator [Magnetovibrio sp.]